MSHEFPAFARLVAARLQAAVKTPNAFVVAIDGDTLYAEYLKAFPEGTNPKFRTNTEHDCSCCKGFIRRAGAVVHVDDRKVLHTVWDAAAKDAPYPYNVVATHLQGLVRAAVISDLYRTNAQDETSFGAEKTYSLDKVTQEACTWSHFYTGELPRHIAVASPGSECGAHRTNVETFERGLKELSPDAISTVLSLIDDTDQDRRLYRGEEHRGAVLKFQAAQTAYRALESDWARNVFVWTTATGPAAHFRGSAIGKLVQDLTEGKDIEFAVRAFETMVAPTTYKRSSAPISPAQVKAAMDKITELGLESALERRLARIEDVSVNDVLWVDGAVKPLMKGGLHDALMKHAAQTSPKSTKTDEERAEDIALDVFLHTILPEATGMELLFKGQHLGNLMVLTAPAHPDVKQLFKWPNNFAWAYAGNVTDSIAERVKKAGGKVEGAQLRVSLSWFNTDDLDLHIKQPPGRGMHSGYDEISFRNKRGWTGGTLDVDMNVSNPVRNAVENVVWMDKIPNGAYQIVVNNYHQRETSDAGFVIEIENAGKVTHYTYNKVVRNGSDVLVVTLHMNGGVIERIDAGDPAVSASNISQERWGLKTKGYVKVNTVTMSPNFWGDSHTGNKHTFFVLDGCKCDEPMRGIFNEYLHPDLEVHRKVFEVIGDKTKCAPDDRALAGLGFSSTKKDSFVIKVHQGRKQRLFNVKVGA